MSIWLRTPSLEQLNAATAGTMMRPLGIVFTEVGPDFLRAAMPATPGTTGVDQATVGWFAITCGYRLTLPKSQILREKPSVLDEK